MNARFPQSWRSPAPPLKLVGQTVDGFTVYDRPTSHRHLVGELLEEALGRTHFGSGSFAKRVVSFERTIAQCDCVLTSGVDQIVFARRPKRHGFTRFVLARKPEPTRVVSLILKSMEEDPKGVILVSAYPGDAEPEPWDRHATPESPKFWSVHALRWGSCEVEWDTLTLHCPWGPGPVTLA